MDEKSLADGSAVERIARFLHLNYPTDCCRVPWAEIDQDCRDGWLTEAAHIYGLATGKHDRPAGFDIPGDFLAEMVREAAELGLYESTDRPMPPRE